VRRWIAPALIVAGVGALAVALLGRDDRQPSVVTVTDAQVVAAPDDTAAFVYVTLTADQDDELISAQVSPDVAAAATIKVAPQPDRVGGHLGHLDPSHTHNGQLAIEMQAGKPLVLEPGGYYIRLEQLTTTLTESASIAVTLTFDSGTVLQINAAA
jgi:copper(I)-binding protein